MKLAERMDRLGTETAFEILARAKALEAQGQDIIHLEIGEPDFDTPAHIVEAAVKALHEGQTHYTPAAGTPALRQAIARITHPETQARKIRVTASIGVATVSAVSQDLENVLNHADEALYKAKHSGRNAVCCADISETA